MCRESPVLMFRGMSLFVDSYYPKTKKARYDWTGEMFQVAVSCSDWEYMACCLIFTQGECVFLLDHPYIIKFWIFGPWLSMSFHYRKCYSYNIHVKSWCKLLKFYLSAFESRHSNDRFYGQAFYLLTNYNVSH